MKTLDDITIATQALTVYKYLTSPSHSAIKGEIVLQSYRDLHKEKVNIQPPIGQDRASELGKWEDRKFKVSGTSWDVNSIDIAAAGLGWFSLGLKGEATLSFWTYDGIEITLREPLVLDRAPFLERPGFWLPKLISDAIGNQSKLEAQKRKKLGDSIESLSEVSA
ncbi:hypothetical protein Pint_17761 [Pistacia integerrima]|uniref:Uncharacterized protein n=1 Tax=Pistacia integerrima TaxID=434235 RepID=A0ACC0YX08_9ROSI|nr:hypothetical protein Pint_17761 [Pistacia integerrima]